MNVCVVTYVHMCMFVHAYIYSYIVMCMCIHKYVGVVNRTVVSIYIHREDCAAVCACVYMWWDV